LPVIRTLATVNLYRDLGTNQSADSAAGTFAVFVEGGRRIASGVHPTGLGDDMLGTEVDANLAALAKLLVDLDIAFGAHLKASNTIFQF
jgi:hypothetical protein